MKIDMNDPKYITKLILIWFDYMSFRLGMKATMPEVGAGQALRGKVDVCTGSRGLLN